MNMRMQRMSGFLSLAVIFLFTVGTSIETNAQQGSVSFQVFYNELQPYGSWFNHPSYGYVWAPNVDNDFMPYQTNGYWTVTQYGNTWVSNYDWGWAPFHYGRWFFDDYYGWIWVPENTWAPAWVVWRNGGGFYGWAPLAPGLSFSLSFSLFNRIPNNYWCFVPQQYVWSHSMYNYCAPRHQNIYIVNHTTYVTHYSGNNHHNYYSGPSHDEIRHATHREVRVQHVESGNRPGRTQVDPDRVYVYRPTVNRNENDKPTHERVPTGNSGNHYGWSRGNGNSGSDSGGSNDNGNQPGSNNGNGNDNGSGGGQSGGNGHPRNNPDNGNNGHGNGDQDPPGNSGGHNNAENSDNSGQGNSGNGKGNTNPRGNTDRTNSSFYRTFPNEQPIQRSSSGDRNLQMGDNRNSGLNAPNRSTNSQTNRTPGMNRTIPERSSGSNRSPAMNYPSRSNNSGSGAGMKMPSRSSSGNPGFSAPTRSSGSRSNGGMSLPSRSSGSSGIKTPSKPSRSVTPRKKN